MEIEQALKVELLEQVKNWNKAAELQSIQTITPDASLRRYYRLELSGAGPTKTIVAMVFDSVKAAEAEGGQTYLADQAYCELAELFYRANIPVAELLTGQPGQRIFLLEDLGDNILGSLFEHCPTIIEHYKSAISVLPRLQSLQCIPHKIPFSRSFSKDLYLKEMDEFQVYFLKAHVPAGIIPTEQVSEAFVAIATRLAELPKVVVHRDYHSWNLIIDQEDQLRIIDFQDALMGVRLYDLISLLHDRDTDALLGTERYQMLKTYARETLQIPKEQFEFEFALTALQRDLKVAGRFEKFAEERGLTTYQRWVPGTFRRIRQALKLLTEEFKLTELKSFSNHLEQIKL
ncbi:phosphotransferase [bacterium]|nr:phosphotransferase [bacterium]